MILAGDVGGTKTNLGLFAIQSGAMVSVAEETYLSKHYPNLETIVREFMTKQRLGATCACFGVAGPVRGGRCEVVNLPWTVDTATLRNELGIDSVFLLNDLEATAHSVAALDSADIVELNTGDAIQAGDRGDSKPTGNRAVIAAGTGLGEAGLFWDGVRHRPFASEGGHATFSPRTKIELALAEYLFNTYGHASWERVLSGPGLVNIYRFLAQANSKRASKPVAEQVSKAGAVAIADAAFERRCEICEQALNLFATLYGAEAGNLALKMLATGGVYIGGGIAAKILPKLQEPAFFEAFCDKGRLKPLLKSIPIRLITTNRAALIGAAEFARAKTAGNLNREAMDQLRPDNWFEASIN